MKIVLGTDHAGYQHKETLRKYLEGKGYEVQDFGTFSEESCDYPDYIYPAARAVAADPMNTRGFIFGGSGQGEAMTANRVKGVRATVYYGAPCRPPNPLKRGDQPTPAPDIIELSRNHNDANVLSIGARFVTVEQMKEAADMWLSLNEPVEERHARRIAKIDRS